MDDRELANDLDNIKRMLGYILADMGYTYDLQTKELNELPEEEDESDEHRIEPKER